MTLRSGMSSLFILGQVTFLLFRWAAIVPPFAEEVFDCSAPGPLTRKRQST